MKLRIVGHLMPDGEVESILDAITSLVGKPRELRVFVEDFNQEVVAHVTTCARAVAAKRAHLDAYWRKNDRRRSESCG